MYSGAIFIFFSWGNENCWFPKKMVTSAKHKRCVNNWDFLLKNMYSRYKGCVKQILCCGDGVVPSICEQLQTFQSWITYKHIFRSYLGPSLNNMYTNDTLWKSNFWTNLKNLINMIFLSCTPPMESFFETFLNCQVKFTPWRWRQINKFNAIIPRDNYFVDLKKQIHSVHWGINSPLKTPLFFFAKPPSLNLQTVQAPPPPLLRQSPPLYIGFLWNRPHINQIFQWTTIIIKFIILNTPSKNWDPVRPCFLKN